MTENVWRTEAAEGHARYSQFHWDMKQIVCHPALQIILFALMMYLLTNGSARADFQAGVDAYERKDYKTALKEWLPLAEEGNPNAQFRLGEMYAKGEGIPRNDVEAVKWLRKAAQQGNARAQFLLGTMYKEEKAELIATLRRIAQNTGAPEDSRSRAQLKIGHLYYGDGEYEKALAEYQAFVQMFPNSELVTNALYQASVCYYQIGQNSTDEGAQQLAFRNAVHTATQVTERNPDVDAAISAYYTIGLAKHALNDNNGAIQAFRQTTSYEGQTEDKPRQDLIRQAHTRLADLNTAVGAHAAAVRGYQYVIQNTDDDDQKGRAYFSIAYAQDEHLKQYDDSLLNYQNAIQLSKDSLIKAQAYYRRGLIYQERLNDPANALKAYETLINQFGPDSNTSIQSMAADAGIRRSDLYLKLGHVQDAIAQAVAAREAAQTIPQKVSAQYNLGLLYFGEARQLFSDKPGTDLQPYIDASRRAATAYVEAANVVPTDKINDTISPFVQNALLSAGQIYYSLGTAIKLPADLNSAIPVLKQFVEYADKGLFAVSSQADVSKNVQTVLGYLALTYYELGRMQLGFDEGFSEKTISFFEQSAGVFMDLVWRFPKAKEAPFWQYQVGEAYFAARKHLKAVEEYRKVRRINPQHAQAAESLAAISTCYALLEKNTGDKAEKEKWLDKVFEVNEVLAKNYPTSPFAAEALLNIGNTYYNQGVLPDVTETDRIRFYTMAIEQYEKALAVPGINAESKENADLFLRDTKNTLAGVFVNIGNTYYNQESLPNAIKWFRKAALQDYAPAQLLLGWMYYEGKGVPQDYSEAVKWFRKAAQQGYTSAQFALGLMYEDGKGIVQNYVTAHMWYNLAGAQGDEKAREFRDRIAEKMTPAQIAEAQRLAGEWKPTTED